MPALLLCLLLPLAIGLGYGGGAFDPSPPTQAHQPYVIQPKPMGEAPLRSSLLHHHPPLTQDALSPYRMSGTTGGLTQPMAQRREGRQP